MNDAQTREQRVHSLRELAAQITELAGHLNAANYRLLTLIAEFDRREGWSDGATQSCAHWLNWQCGIELGAAREKVRVARAGEAAASLRGHGPWATELFEEEGMHITADTAVTQWRGESMDYGLAVEVLLRQARRGRNVSAESQQTPADAATCRH